MLRILSILIASLFAFTAHANKPMVVYYESWSANSHAEDIKSLPTYVNHLMISFAKPDATYSGNLDLSASGLNLPYSGHTLKEAILIAKEKNSQLKVLLAVGGATYHHWEALNATALAQIVNDLGLDGIDIDYEAPEPNGELVNHVTQTLRNALPQNKLLTMAVMHVAAYGQDEWTNSQPTGSIWTGFFHEISPALNHIDMINVMSYDAGSSYDALEAYAAFNHYYQGLIAMGMQVPPEAWGDHVWTVNKVENISEQLTTTDGLMLWSMHKDNEEVSDNNPDYPSANLLGSSACIYLALASDEICSTPLLNDQNSSLTFRNDSNENGIYFVVDAMPYGYPRTESINVGAETTLTGIDIPITTTALPIFVYTKTLGYEAPCLNANTGNPLTLNWTPENIVWRVNFWLDNTNRPWCSAAESENK